MANEATSDLCMPNRQKIAVMLARDGSLFQHPPIIRTAAACGPVDAETSSA
jgi:hypothetical protein